MRLEGCDGRPRSARIRHSKWQRLRGSRADVSHVRDADEDLCRSDRGHCDPHGDFPHLNADLRDDAWIVSYEPAGIWLSALRLLPRAHPGEPQAAAASPRQTRWQRRQVAPLRGKDVFDTLILAAVPAPPKQL